MAALLANTVSLAWSHSPELILVDTVWTAYGIHRIFPLFSIINSIFKGHYKRDFDRGEKVKLILPTELSDTHYRKNLRTTMEAFIFAPKNKTAPTVTRGALCEYMFNGLRERIAQRHRFCNSLAASYSKLDPFGVRVSLRVNGRRTDELSADSDLSPELELPSRHLSETEHASSKQKPSSALASGMRA
jgi:hypothetical protein